MNALIEVVGVNDKLDGYKIDELDPAEVEYHRRRGRLP